HSNLYPVDSETRKTLDEDVFKRIQGAISGIITGEIDLAEEVRPTFSARPRVGGQGSGITKEVAEALRTSLAKMGQSDWRYTLTKDDMERIFPILLRSLNSHNRKEKVFAEIFFSLPLDASSMFEMIDRLSRQDLKYAVHQKIKAMAPTSPVLQFALQMYAHQGNYEAIDTLIGSRIFDREAYYDQVSNNERSSDLTVSRAGERADLEWQKLEALLREGSFDSSELQYYNYHWVKEQLEQTTDSIKVMRWMKYAKENGVLNQLGSEFSEKFSQFDENSFQYHSGELFEFLADSREGFDPAFLSRAWSWVLAALQATYDNKDSSGHYLSIAWESFSKYRDQIPQTLRVQYAELFDTESDGYFVLNLMVNGTGEDPRAEFVRFSGLSLEDRMMVASKFIDQIAALSFEEMYRLYQEGGAHLVPDKMIMEKAEATEETGERVDRLAKVIKAQVSSDGELKLHVSYYDRFYLLVAHPELMLEPYGLEWPSFPERSNTRDVRMLAALHSVYSSDRLTAFYSAARSSLSQWELTAEEVAQIVEPISNRNELQLWLGMLPETTRKSVSIHLDDFMRGSESLSNTDRLEFVTQNPHLPLSGTVFDLMESQNQRPLIERALSRYSNGYTLYRHTDRTVLHWISNAVEKLARSEDINGSLYRMTARELLFGVVDAELNTPDQQTSRIVNTQTLVAAVAGLYRGISQTEARKIIQLVALAPDRTRLEIVNSKPFLSIVFAHPELISTIPPTQIYANWLPNLKFSENWDPRFRAFLVMVMHFRETLTIPVEQFAELVPNILALALESYQNGNLSFARELVGYILNQGKWSLEALEAYARAEIENEAEEEQILRVLPSVWSKSFIDFIEQKIASQETPERIRTLLNQKYQSQVNVIYAELFEHFYDRDSNLPRVAIIKSMRNGAYSLDLVNRVFGYKSAERKRREQLMERLGELDFYTPDLEDLTTRMREDFPRLMVPAAPRYSYDTYLRA
ncbi:MAG: hypothetical protein AAF202_03090, partial [Pseudomonadota bacterium]